MQRDGERRREPQFKRPGKLCGSDAPAIEEAMERGSRQQRHGESVQFCRASGMIVIVRATGTDRVTEPRWNRQRRIARGKERKQTAQPASSTSSGSKPKTATPNNMPAVSGTTTRARSRASVSQMPSAAPHTPTAVASAGVSRPVVAKGASTLSG